MNIMLGHANQIVLSNLHNIHKLPNIFVLTYTQQNIVWTKNWWFYKVHFSTLMVDFTDSSKMALVRSLRKIILGDKSEKQQTCSNQSLLFLMSWESRKFTCNFMNVLVPMWSAHNRCEWLWWCDETFLMQTT